MRLLASISKRTKLRRKLSERLKAKLVFWWLFTELGGSWANYSIAATPAVYHRPECEIIQKWDEDWANSAWIWGGGFRLKMRDFFFVGMFLAFSPPLFVDRAIHLVRRSETKSTFSWLKSQNTIQPKSVDNQLPYGARAPAVSARNLNQNVIWCRVFRMYFKTLVVSPSFFQPFLIFPRHILCFFLCSHRLQAFGKFGLGFGADFYYGHWIFCTQESILSHAFPLRLDIPSSGLVGYPSYPLFVDVEFLDQFIHSSFDDIAPSVLPFTGLNHNQGEILSLRLKSHIPKYLCSFNIPKWEAGNKCLESCSDYPKTSEDGHRYCCSVEITSCKGRADLDRTLLCTEQR